MTTIAYFPSNKKFLRNICFDRTSSRDEVWAPYADLRDSLQGMGIALNTFDLYINELPDILLVARIDANFKNVLKFKRRNPNSKIIYLVSEERAVCKYHTKKILDNELFDLVMTWDKALLSEKKYHRYQYPNPTRKYRTLYPFEGRRHLCLISGYKKKSWELTPSSYSLREQVAQFFSDKEISVYGHGWEKSNLITNKAVIKGPVKSKIETLGRYKFSICFENSFDELGAVSEKIFDSMAAGCIPVYYGAPDIEDYVPKDCFIDYRNFENLNELSKFLCEMDQAEYIRRQECCKKYLLGDSYKEFTEHGFIMSMIGAIEEIKGIEPTTREKISSMPFRWAILLLRNIRLFWGFKRLYMDVFCSLARIGRP